MDKKMINKLYYLILGIGVIAIAGLCFTSLPGDTTNNPKNEVINDKKVEVNDSEAAAMYDLVVIDVDGTIDGNKFEGGTGEGLTTILGAGQMIPGFEDQIVGHKAGDKFEIRVTFPNDYGEESLNGKEAIFKTVLHEVWRNVGTDLGEDMYSNK